VWVIGEPSHRGSDSKTWQQYTADVKAEVAQHRVVMLPDRARRLYRLESLNSPTVPATAPGSKRETIK